MPDDLRVRIFDGREHALGHRAAFQAHKGVHGNDHDVEFGENVVRQIEAAILQYVHFDAGQKANAGLAFVRGANFARLLEGARFVHAVGECQRLAVIGDGDVLVSERARRRGHGFDRVLAVGGRRMHLQIAAKVAQLNQVRRAGAARRPRFRRSSRATPAE